ncbi:hypothetical protein PMIN06_005406, partial [Paraphaeosphaeria minitans]
MHVGVRQALYTRAVSIQASTYNKVPSYLAIAATLVSFALLIFLLRVYTRTRLLRFFAIDDWLMLGAAVSISNCCCCSAADGHAQVGLIVALAVLVHVDLSGQQDDYTIGDTRNKGLFLWIFEICSILSIVLVKTSAACLLLRTVKTVVYTRLLHIIAAIVASTGFVWFATVLLQCVPVRAAWDSERRADARCMQYDIFSDLIVSYNSIDAATNLVFAILPMSAFWSSHHTIRSKLSLLSRVTVTALGLMY